MIIFFLITFSIAFDYEKALKSGQRKFSSTNLKGSTPEESLLKYEIEFPERLHHLVYDSNVEDIICSSESLDLFVKEKMDIQEGDVIIGKEQEGCKEGIYRVVKTISLVRSSKDSYEYHIETRNAKLEEIFVKADIQLNDQQDGNLKRDYSDEVFSNTFSKTHTENFYNGVNKKVSSTLSFNLPITLKNFRYVHDDDNKSFRMETIMSPSVSFETNVMLKKSFYLDKEKKICSKKFFKIPIPICGVILKLNLDAVFRTGIMVGFQHEATAFYSQSKQFDVTIVFDSEKSEKISASADDANPNNKPTFTLDRKQVGHIYPYLKVSCEFGIGVGIFSNILKGGPYIKLKTRGNISLDRASFTPVLTWGYSAKLFEWDPQETEKTLKTGKSHDVYYHY